MTLSETFEQDPVNRPREQRLVNPPAGYDPLIARWVGILEDARLRTKECLDEADEAVVDWAPATGGNSIGSLLYHIAAIELDYLYDDILGRGWAPELEPLLPYDVRDGQGRLTAVRGETLVQHLARLDGGRTLLLKTLAKMTPADFYRPRRLEGYDITPEWTLHHLMQHEAEHRGQISVILELWRNRGA